MSKYLAICVGRATRQHLIDYSLQRPRSRLGSLQQPDPLITMSVQCPVTSKIPRRASLTREEESVLSILGRQRVRFACFVGRGAATRDNKVCLSGRFGDRFGRFPGCMNVSASRPSAAGRGKLSGRRRRSSTTNWQKGKFDVIGHSVRMYPGFCADGAVGSERWRANTRTLTCGVLTGEQRWLTDVPDDHEQPGSVASKCVGPAPGMRVGCAHASSGARARAAARRHTASAAVACALPIRPRGAGCGVRAAGPAPHPVEHGPFGGPLRCRVR
jgi:hypothetical protein